MKESTDPRAAFLRAATWHGSLKEAEDVIAVLTSFAAFDRLHQDGRRSTAAVIEILMRMAGSIINPSP